MGPNSVVLSHLYVVFSDNLSLSNPLPFAVVYLRQACIFLLICCKFSHVIFLFSLLNIWFVRVGIRTEMSTIRWMYGLMLKECRTNVNELFCQSASINIIDFIKDTRS